MASNQTLLDNLIEDIPEVITQLDAAIEKIEDQISFLQDDQTGVEHVMSMMTTAASAWMDIKAAELDAISASAVTSGSWGISNLTDWAIVCAGTPIYGWGQVTSGAPSAAETQQYNRQIDFPLAYDHIYHSLGTDGTYGLDAKISNLQTGKSLQESNRSAFKGFLKAYDRNNGL